MTGAECLTCAIVQTMLGPQCSSGLQGGPVSTEWSTHRTGWCTPIIMWLHVGTQHWLTGYHCTCCTEVAAVCCLICAALGMEGACDGVLEFGRESWQLRITATVPVLDVAKLIHVLHVDCLGLLPVALVLSLLVFDADCGG